MITNPNEPLNCNNGNGFWNDELNRTHAGIGLTKREYFAAMAMQGLLSGSSTNIQSKIPYDYSKIAINMADALIKELNKEEDNK